MTDQSTDNLSAYRLTSGLYSYSYLKQTIPAGAINIAVGDTLILSAWAKANSLEVNEDSDAKFELRAEAHYTDNTTGASVSASYDSSFGGWQYAALPLRINLAKTLEYVQIFLDYSNNNGACLFDNVRLVNSLATSAKHEDNLRNNITIFGKTQTIREKSTQHDGIYTTIIEKNDNYDVVRQTVTDQDGNSFVSVSEYNDAHKPIRTQNYRNIMTEYVYNNVGMPELTKTYYYAEFNPNVTAGSFSVPQKCFMNEVTYDSSGEFAVSASDQRSEEIKTQSDYNITKGLLNSTTSPNGQLTSFTYDDKNDLVTKVSSIVDNNEYSVLYGYTNRKLSSITHNGFEYSFTYDSMGRAKKVQIAGVDYTTNDYILTDTTTVTTTYASGEKMIVETDRNQQPIKRTYVDKDGNETVVAEGECDELGKPEKVVDNAAGMVYTCVYNS